MPKIYRNANVYQAAMERYEIIYNNFDNYYFSVSGGKDSSVMIQLAAQKAREMGKKISVLFIDLEAQYAATIYHINELIEGISDVLDTWYWIALPLSLRNAVSVIQPKWICWDKKDKKKWVREMPKNQWVINEDNYPEAWDWFTRGMEFEDFILFFAKWFNQEHGGLSATGIGIRSNESINRFRTILSHTKERFNGYGWTTRMHVHSDVLDVYNFFPLYDWTTEDIWTAVSRFDLLYNEIYELMYKNGLSIHDQRLCQPYGDDQKNGLDQFRYLEFETWEKVLNRVHGVNFGNIYCRTSLLGNLKSEKPDGMSWEQYAVFLLESLGLYAPELRDHYYNKIRTFFLWYKKQGIQVPDIKEEEDKKLEAAKQVASWRRIARAIERNDFWMKRLSFGQTKQDVERLFELKKKYANIVHAEDTTDKDLKKVAFDLVERKVVMSLMEINNSSEEFYQIMGPVFGSRKIESETGDRIYDDSEKLWCVALGEERRLSAFISIKNNEIKNIYGDQESLVSLLAKYKDQIGMCTVTNHYRLLYLEAGYQIIKEKSKNFIIIRGNYNGEN